ncbi:MAG: family transposase [Burkholderiales bacterium]|jgi:transposase-like protein|nr:family transposase [Burkholderiales bacterium]
MAKNPHLTQDKLDLLARIPEDVIELISSGVKTQSDLQAMITGLKSRIIESALNGEMNHHLSNQSALNEGPMQPNRRNGYSNKVVKTDTGDLSVNIPRDRTAEFEPLLVKKYKRRLEGIDDAVLALYSRGMSMRDIRATINELYHQDLSEELISNITDCVNDEVKEWQNRPLEHRYTILYLDCVVIKVQENKSIINKAVYLALGVNTSGIKELLGLWIAQTEGAKFWLNLKEVFIACCDGLTGFPDAIAAIYPECEVQSCIVHMVRNSLAYVPYKDRKEVAADLKTIYQADTEDIAMQNLAEFTKKWDKKYPAICKSWYNRWNQLNTLFGYTTEIRKVIYTTNAIESLNMTLRKVMKNKRVFPNDTAVFKTMYLAILNISRRWTMPIRDWAPAYQQMLIKFGKFTIIH